MFGIGAGEFILILIVGLIVFGPGKLPEVGRALGKGLKEFRKAQAALSATLEESAKEPAPKTSTEKKSSTDKKSSTEKISSTDEKSVSEKISADKNPYDEQPADEKISDDKKISTEKNSVDESEKQSSMTVDDVINLAKQSPIKEQSNEKNLTSNDGSTADPADSGRDEPARSDSDSTGKQSESAKN